MSYTMINELMAIEFHDSSLESMRIEGDELRMVFSGAIIVGRSRPGIEGRIRSSVNSGEDRYAIPELRVALRGYAIRSLAREDRDAHAMRELLAGEYGSFFSMIEGFNHVYSLSYDPADDTYCLGFILNAEDCYYEMQFSAETAIAEFEEFGKDAWYLEDKWRMKHGDK